MSLTVAVGKRRTNTINPSNRMSHQFRPVFVFHVADRLDAPHFTWPFKWTAHGARCCPSDRLGHSCLLCSAVLCCAAIDVQLERTACGVQWRPCRRLLLLPCLDKARRDVVLIFPAVGVIVYPPATHSAPTLSTWWTACCSATECRIGPRHPLIYPSIHSPTHSPTSPSIKPNHQLIHPSLTLSFR
jgi:hypothetical protein